MKRTVCILAVDTGEPLAGAVGFSDTVESGVGVDTHQQFVDATDWA